jgi:hypothetical protein
MKKNPWRGGRGLLRPIIGGRIGMMVRIVSAHIPTFQFVTKDLLLIMSRVRGEAQVVAPMQVPRHVAVMAVDLAVDLAVMDTVNQCGGWRPVYFKSSFLAVL